MEGGNGQHFFKQSNLSLMISYNFATGCVPTYNAA